MLIKGIILSVASVLLVQHATASFLGSSGKNIIDQLPLEGDALNKLCSDSNQRISKVSTITWLLEKFESLNDESLAHCKALYLEPLRILNKVTSQYSDDACSLDKISWIDHFHWNYQMGAMSSKWTGFAKAALPEPLKMFFLHYASEIAAVCKANLPESIDSAAKQRDSSEDEAYFGADFGPIVKSFQQVLIPFDKIKHFDDFILLWDLLVNYERKKNNDIIIVDPKTGEEFVAVVKVKDASKVWRAQQRCRQVMRPIYKNTILPVMKLIDMGYDKKDKQSGDEIGDNGEQKNWYTLTQTCELILPLKFYQDESMEEMEMARLESIEAAGAYTEEQKPTTEVSQVEVRAISQPEELNLDADEIKLLKSVKSNAKGRGNLYWKVVRNAISSVLNRNLSENKQVLTMVKKLQHPEGRSPIPEDELSEKTLTEADQLLKEDDEFLQASKNIGHHKWNFSAAWKGLRKVVKRIVLVILAIIVVLFFLAVFAAICTGR